jgi:hypothetical protein
MFLLSFYLTDISRITPFKIYECLVQAEGVLPKGSLVSALLLGDLSSMATPGSSPIAPISMLE